MIAVRYNRARGNEIEVLAYIMSQTLEEPDTFFEVKDSPNAPEQEVKEFVVTKEDYIDEFDVDFHVRPRPGEPPAARTDRPAGLQRRDAGRDAQVGPCSDPRPTERHDGSNRRRGVLPRAGDVATWPSW
jgi:hypothetical protein